MKKTIVLLALTLGFCCVSAAGGNKPEPYHQGLHYHRIDPPVESKTAAGKVEVIEVFFYACPHCYELQPKMARWLKTRPYVDFRQLPAIIGPTWADQARAFFIAKQLDPTDRLHNALFEAIHKQGMQIYNRYGVIDFFTAHGIPLQRAVQLYESEAILQKTNDAREKTVRYGLRGVPAVVVNGKYVTAPYFVRNQEEMLQVLEFLVEKERKNGTGEG